MYFKGSLRGRSKAAVRGTSPLAFKEHFNVHLEDLKEKSLLKVPPRHATEG